LVGCVCIISFKFISFPLPSLTTDFLPFTHGAVPSATAEHRFGWSLECDLSTSRWSKLMKPCCGALRGVHTRILELQSLEMNLNTGGLVFQPYLVV
jgi:hypothetical protein